MKDCPHKGDTCIRCGERGHFAAGCSKPFAGAKTTKAKTGEKRRLGGDDLDDDFVAGGRDDGDGVDGDASEDAGVEAEEVEAESKKNPSRKSRKRTRRIERLSFPDDWFARGARVCSDIYRDDFRSFRLSFAY